MAANAAEQAHMATVMACMLGALLQKLERVKYKTLTSTGTGQISI